MRNAGFVIGVVLLAASSASAQQWKSGSDMLKNQASVGSLEAEVRMLELDIQRRQLLKQKKELERQEREDEFDGNSRSKSNDSESQVPKMTASFPFEGYTVVETYSAPEADSFSALIRGPNGEVVVERGVSYSGWVAVQITLGGAKFVLPGTDVSRILGLAGS